MTATKTPATQWFALRKRIRCEQGAVSVFAVVAALAILVAAGLAIDGARRARTAQLADMVAAEAGRAATQQIKPGPAIRGRGVSIDPAKAAAAARAYLADAGAQGTVTVRGSRVEITTRIPWRPIMLDVIGVQPRPMHGRATVQLIHQQ